MRRTLNVKLFLGLIVAAALAGGGVHAVHGFQENRNAGALLRRADRAQKKGDLEEAEKFLGRYLAFRPDDADALARYGLLLDKRAATGQERMRALLVLERALQRGPGSDDALRLDVRRRAAALAMSPEFGRFKDAAAHLETLLRATPGDGALELDLGRCHESLARTGRREEADGEYRRARAWYEKAIAHAPGRIEGYVLLAELLRGPLGDPGRADAVMDAREVKEGAVARNPESARAYLERGRYRTKYKLAGSEDDVARALELAPGDADVLMTAAGLARKRGDLDSARALFKRGEASDPKDAAVYKNQAGIELQAGHREEAVAILRRGVEVLPDRIDIRWHLADLLISEGKPEDARKEIDRLRQDDRMPTAVLDYLEAQLLIGENRWPEAVRTLEKSRALLANVPALKAMTAHADLFLAQCYGRLALPEQQLAASRRALELDPNLVHAEVERAAALRELRRYDEAIAAYRQLIPRVPAARISLARLLVDRNLRLPPGRRRDPALWTEAGALLGQLEREEPASIEAPLVRAEVLANRGQLEEARALAEGIRKAHPDRVEPWIALAVLAEHRGGPDRAFALLDEAQRALGDRAEIRLARLDCWSRRGGDAAREALAGIARGLDALAPEDRARLEDRLADVYARLGELREAERILDAAAARRPDDLRVATRLHDLALLRGDDAALQQSSDRLRRIEGEDGVLWRFTDATRLVRQAAPGDEKPLASARTLLAEVARRRPEWAKVPLLEADIAEKERNPDRAIEGYLKAIRGGERPPQAIRRAFQLLDENGRSAEADRLVQDLLEQAPPEGVLGQLAAEVALRRGEKARALELARQAVAPDSKDARDRLWLGRIYGATDHPKEAEAELRRAVAMTPADPEAWLALVLFLGRSDRKDQAEAAILEARRRLPPDRAPLALAQLYAAIGRPEQAEAQFRAALDARPDEVSTLQDAAYFYLGSGQHRKAEPLLRKILDPRLKGAPWEIAAARRGLALSLVGGGEGRPVSEAIALVDQNLQDKGGTLEDRRLRALLLVTNPSYRREAIRAFEEISRRSPPGPGEKLLLAQLYVRGRDWSKARVLLLDLLATDGENPTYLTYYARVLVDQGEGDEADQWIAKLEKAAPRDPSTVELKARRLEAQGKGKEAVALLLDLDRRKEVAVDTLASLLEGLGHPAEAETLYRKLVAQPRRPEDVLSFAQFLARRGRPGEALDRCDQAWQTCPPETVGAISVGILYGAGPKAGEEERRRVGSRLEEAIRKNPDSVPLRFALANLRILEGRYADVEATYREILRRNDHVPGPYNNLAVLLAVLKDGRESEALALANRALALAGPAPDLLDTRALVYLAQGQAAAAIKDLEEALGEPTAPESSRAIWYFHLAQARLMSRDRKAATDALGKARAAGFTADSLPPLERGAYDQLAGELVR